MPAPPARDSARHAGHKPPTAESPTFEAVIDSGCTWHAHPHLEELILTHPYDDKISTADGANHTAICIAIGGLLVWAYVYNSTGMLRTIGIPNVRYVPTFTWTHSSP